MQPDFPLAARLASASALAYAPYAPAANIGIVSNTLTDTRVIVVHSPGETIFAFEGTADFRMALHDGEVRLTGAQDLPAREGRIHCGVLASVESVIDQLIGICRGLPEDEKIYVTGHSFGGGCAVPTAYLFAIEGIPVAGVHTFAGMRAVDATFAANYDKLLGSRTVRWVAQYDVVPHLPLPTFFLPYRHVGTEAYITDVAADDRLSLPTLTLDRGLAALLWADGWTMFKAYQQSRLNPLSVVTELPREIVMEHAIGRYQRLIGKLAASGQKSEDRSQKTEVGSQKPGD